MARNCLNGPIWRVMVKSDNLLTKHSRTLDPVLGLAAGGDVAPLFVPQLIEEILNHTEACVFTWRAENESYCLFFIKHFHCILEERRISVKTGENHLKKDCDKSITKGHSPAAWNESLMKTDCFLAKKVNYFQWKNLLVKETIFFFCKLLTPSNCNEISFGRKVYLQLRAVHDPHVCSRWSMCPGNISFFLGAA